MAISEADILGGIERSEFYPVFQPIVELAEGKIIGFEVLARWDTGRDKSVAPDVFIPAAEELGLINEISSVILRQGFACGPVAGSNLRLSFNLSSTQLLDPQLPAKLESLAREGAFPLHRLTIEVTETALVDDLDRAAKVAGVLKSLGCRLALDDFGTGYSSMKHLHSLPFDELKIDKSFVQSMTERRESRKIVASVISLGHSLELTTVAEGIEKQEQAEMLFWMGCNCAQGWHFGAPVSGSDVGHVMGMPAIQSSRRAFCTRNSDPALTLEAVPAHRLAQLQAIYDGAPVGLCFLDRQMRYVSLNQQLAKMNNVPVAEHIGRRVADVIPQVFPLIEAYIRRALGGEAITGLELTKPASATQLGCQTVLLSYQPVRDEIGEVVGVSVAATDITHRKIMEQELQRTQEHYRYMVNLSPQIPWVIDRNGKVMDAGPRWEELTGQSLAEAMGDGWLGCLHPCDVAPTREVIDRAIALRVPMDVTYRIRSADGEWKWMRSRGAPRVDQGDEVDMVYGVLEEIDESRQPATTCD